MKTLKWRGSDWPRFALCDGCWLPIREAVWIVPGGLRVAAKCSRCGHWLSVVEFASLAGEHGTCVQCLGEEAF